MQPDGIVRCVAPYTGMNYKGQKITLREGKQYFKTVGEKFIYLNDHDQPRIQLPWLTPEEYAKLYGTYLK